MLFLCTVRCFKCTINIFGITLRCFMEKLWWLLPAKVLQSEFSPSACSQSIHVGICSWVCVYLEEQLVLGLYGTPTSDPVIPFQNHPQPSPKSGGLNTASNVLSHKWVRRRAEHFLEQHFYSFSDPKSLHLYVHAGMCAFDPNCTTEARSKPAWG